MAIGSCRRAIPWTWALVLVSVLCITSVVRADEKSPEVCARSGCVTGLSVEGGVGKPYEAFLGLPYARPPTKRYRWQVRIIITGTFTSSDPIQVTTFLTM